MENIRLPEELLPQNLKKPAAFIAEKNPDLPDYGVHTGDLVIVEQESEFTEGELSVFMNDHFEQPKYLLSTKQVEGYTIHFGKIIMTIKYYGKSNFTNSK